MVIPQYVATQAEGGVGMRGSNRTWRLFACWFLTALRLWAQDAALDEEFPDFGEAEELVVTAPPDTTAQVKVVSREEIDRIAATDIPTLPEEALDINITRHGAYGNSSDVNIRGFDTERIAVLVDGVPVNSPMSGDVNFDAIDMNNIDRIEVIYGGSDSKYKSISGKNRRMNMQKNPQAPTTC
jgi:vitamin B12 transporter